MKNSSLAIPLRQIVVLLSGGYEIFGDVAQIVIESFKPVTDGQPESASFIDAGRKDTQRLLENTVSRVVFCDITLKADLGMPGGKTVIFVADPRKEYSKIVRHFIKPTPVYGIHHTAVIDPEAIIDPESYIGPFTYIGKVTIGKGTVLRGHNYVYDGTVIGKNVFVDAGTIIGADGFGFERNEEGILVNFPHIGGVIIEDNADIGANTCVDKGALGNTRILEGAKIDNLIQVGHNVVMGKGAMAMANAMLGGSTVIGEDCWVAPSCTLRDGLRIGARAMTGMGAVITKDVPEDEIWTGMPGRELNALKKHNQSVQQLIDSQKQAAND